MPPNPNRRILFYVDNKTLERYLEKYPLDQRHAVARRAFDDLLDGKARSVQAEETVELRKRKLRLEIEEKEKTAELRLRKMTTEIAEYNAASLVAAGPNPST